MRWLTTIIAYTIVGFIIGALFFPFGIRRKSDVGLNIIYSTIVGAACGVVHVAFVSKKSEGSD